MTFLSEPVTKLPLFDNDNGIKLFLTLTNAELLEFGGNEHALTCMRISTAVQMDSLSKDVNGPECSHIQFQLTDVVRKQRQEPSESCFGGRRSLSLISLKSHQGSLTCGKSKDRPPPSRFSTDVVQWLMKNLSIEDPVEAIHLGSLIAAQGYIFPISDHVLTMKDDGTFYRFQAPYFWPSNCWEPENTDYAIYLCKRTMQNKARLELADYEAENLARLQRAFARKWEFIFMQAEAQVKIDRKKDKTERKILDSQERAFWDVHRPVPGCVNTTEMDIRKCRRLKNPQKVKKSVYGVTEESQSQSPVHIPSQPIRKTTKDDIRKQITFLNAQIDRHCLKMSKVAESLIAYTEQYVEYDPFITPAEPSNPWISDDITLWDIEMSKEPSQQRVKRWGFSFDEILKDQVGRDQFLRFLESEFSSENLRFWLAVQDLKKQPLQDVAKRVEEIWQEFLAPGAPSAINLDSHSYERTSQNVKDGGRYTFEDAQEHIYKLMKSDSYARFLRSNAYQDLLLAKKKVFGVWFVCHHTLQACMRLCMGCMAVTAGCASGQGLL
ncbi:Regulator of G-protein signaling 6 [Microtus ochrogaster]|uniref:Regulator of G-protein signaling 6 n=1 Tax=Microtus ochrogaster TaxID=79684 RepID=A0A8J6KZS4_MICOH|nr:Regulator of G-protein signaling 6 [Microtus ochrogaster]